MDRDLEKPTTGRSTTETCAWSGHVSLGRSDPLAAGLAMQQIRWSGSLGATRNSARPSRTTSTSAVIKEFYR